MAGLFEIQDIFQSWWQRNMLNQNVFFN